MTTNNQAFWDVVTGSYPDEVPPTDAETIHQEISRDELPDIRPHEPTVRMMRDSVSDVTRGIMVLAACTGVIWSLAMLAQTFLT